MPIRGRTERLMGRKSGRWVNMRKLSRRDMLSGAAGIAAALPLLSAAENSPRGIAPPAHKLKVVVAGAHPDDPETGCGGTIARYSDLGHNVTVLYLTRGERGIKGKTYDEAGRIRTGEAEKACEILKARPVFAGQINGKVEVTYARYEEYRKILEAENPDLVFTH